MRVSSRVVLKFGGSVLRDESRLNAAAQEVRRYVERGLGVVAVVSAFRGRTDELIRAARAARGGWEGGRRLEPELVGLGEMEAAAGLALAIEGLGVGLAAEVFCARRLRLVAEGNDPLASLPVAMDPEPLEWALEAGRVAVVPGFTAVDGLGRTVLLGRGGTDLTAVFVGAAIGAEVRLVKDVGSIMEWSPEDGRGPSPRRFASITFEDALALSDRAIQPAAVRLARRLGRPFRFTGLGSDEGTLVGDGQTRLEGEVSGRTGGMPAVGVEVPVCERARV